jgi:putative endonuclease
VEKSFFVYILATRKHGPLYVGVTSNLPTRIAQHKAHLVDGFTKRFNVDRLVYFEAHASAESAILREKQLKRWRREWKEALIEKDNPDWRDLYEEIAFF